MGNCCYVGLSAYCRFYRAEYFFISECSQYKKQNNVCSVELQNSNNSSEQCYQIDLLKPNMNQIKNVWSQNFSQSLPFLEVSQITFPAALARLKTAESTISKYLKQSKTIFLLCSWTWTRKQELVKKIGKATHYKRHPRGRKTLLPAAF